MADCATKMLFLEPWAQDKENPYYRTDPDPSFDVKNFEWLEYDVTVHDARPNMSKFSLDKNGFAFIPDPKGGDKQILDLFLENDDAKIREAYYPQCERLVKEATGASKVMVFNHTVRRRDPSIGLFGGSKGRQQPASTVHCDQTSTGAIRRVQQYLGEDAERALKGRCQIVNVWRPLIPEVDDWPLGVMDGTTVEKENLHPTDLWKKQYEPLGQTMNISYAAGQKWYYLKGHRSTEVTLVKIWDNSKEVAAKLCPHGAFQDPSTREGVPLRESVEARCLVFYD